MLAALLLTIIPTILMQILLPRIGIKIKSTFLNVTFPWFAGLYLVTFAVFLAAIFYSFFTAEDLIKAVFSILIVCELALFFYLKRLTPQKTHKKKALLTPINIFLIVFCFIFSFIFFAPHLATRAGEIYRSPIYWDFHWHVAVIQNFVYGDNFPPQNEAFAGVPMTYHFFGDFVIAMYEACGLSLTNSITLTSILFFFCALLSIIGFCEEIFSSRLTGFFAVCLSITQSSGHFIYYFLQQQGQSLSQIILGTVKNSELAWYTSFIQSNPFNYQGIMFNLFFFLEERHLLIAPVYLLFCLWIIYNREQLSKKMLFLLGIFMGLFFYWNIFITFMIIVGLLAYFLVAEKKQSLFLITLGCLLVIGIQYGFIKELMQNSIWFVPGMTNYPRFNPTFAVSPASHSFKEFFSTFVGFYGFGLGLKAFLAPISLIILWKENKKFMLLLLAFTIPAFIIINTFQISPSGVGESHPILLLVIILLNLSVAFLLFRLFSRNLLYKLLALAFLFLLTISGIIENAPFINSKPNLVYANQASVALAQIIQRNTPPKAVVVGHDSMEIQLAGRKLFVGESAGPALALNMALRNKIVNNIYRARSTHELCMIVKNKPITYIEFKKSDIFYPQISRENLPFFKAYSAAHDPLLFLNASLLCKNN